MERLAGSQGGQASISQGFSSPAAPSPACSQEARGLGEDSWAVPQGEQQQHPTGPSTALALARGKAPASGGERCTQAYPAPARPLPLRVKDPAAGQGW